jgi:predicted nucleic acid-binding Zn ribbon protein
VTGEPGGERAPGGAEPPVEPTGVDLARVALRAAREQARARGAMTQTRRQARRGGGLRSGAWPGGRDPLPLGAAVRRLTVERGWEMPLAVGGVLSRWPDLVGPDVARHCAPEGYDEESRVLTVRCDATAWATQLRLLAPRLLARLNADLGDGTVKVIKVLGPAGVPRGTGRLRAPGSQGPGDTYG